MAETPRMTEITAASHGGAVKRVYATPLYTHVWPDAEATNRELARLILSRMPAEAQNRQSNVGGWHSGPDLLSWGGPAVAQLGQWIGTAIKTMTLETGGLTSVPGMFGIWAWANVLKPGGYNTVHSHDRYAWAGVYYVATGEADPANAFSGLFECVDPRMARSAVPIPGDPYRETIRIRPQPGLMVLFPGWLNHFVHPHTGSGTRIAIAFNVAYKEPDGANATLPENLGTP
jgi:uncharacterized protein (TIGR02466 family)